MTWFKKDIREPIVAEVSLEKEYSFMYENFVVSNQNDLYLLIGSDRENIHALKFTFSIYKYGYPNDEVGHPLMQYGLGFYGLYQVKNSPWIEEIKFANSGHPRHDDSRYDNHLHFVAKFKDVTLEVICREMKEVMLSKDELFAFIAQEISYLTP